MPGHTKSGRSRRKLGRFIALEHHLLNSLAWSSLTPGARSALIEIWQRCDGKNNGTLAMSARVLVMALGVGRATANRAVLDLLDRGFIETVTPSSFACKIKRAAEYRLTMYRCDVTGALPSKPFMAWKPGIKPASTGIPSDIAKERAASGKPRSRWKNGRCPCGLWRASHSASANHQPRGVKGDGRTGQFSDALNTRACGALAIAKRASFQHP